MNHRILEWGHSVYMNTDEPRRVDQVVWTHSFVCVVVHSKLSFLQKSLNAVLIMKHSKFGVNVTVTQNDLKYKKHALKWYK